MKDFIVGVGIFILLMAFPLQYALDQHNHHIKSEFQYIVNNAKERAKQEGYFTEEIINEMTDEIENKLNIPKDKIIINVTKTPKYRTNEFDERELIYFDIRIPIHRVIAAGLLWGIDDSENKSEYPIIGFTTSEKILK